MRVGNDKGVPVAARPNGPKVNMRASEGNRFPGRRTQIHMTDRTLLSPANPKFTGVIHDPHPKISEILSKYTLPHIILGWARKALRPQVALFPKVNSCILHRTSGRRR